MKTTIKKWIRAIVLFYKIKVLKDPFKIQVARWFKDKGDDTLSIEYPLIRDSIVFDVGGYRGEWTEKIVRRYNPYVYIFEPVPEYYANIVQKFKSNPKIFIFNFGLADKDEQKNLALLSDSSSIYRKGKNYIQIQLKDIFNFLEEKKISAVDLVKINIEGGEYPLLERIIEAGTTAHFKNIQVQFHYVVPDAPARRNAIQEGLRKTHHLTYEYPFVWENWEKTKT